ncbi:hypothetical protein [Nonomuraea sp. bgisy101]
MLTVVVLALVLASGVAAAMVVAADAANAKSQPHGAIALTGRNHNETVLIRS